MAALTVRGTITPLAGSSRSSIDVHGWTGWIPDLQNMPDRYHRPGSSGGGTQTVGKSAFAEIACWRAEANITSAEATIENLEALQNIVCRMKDAWGRTIKRVRVDAISVTPIPGKGPNITGGAVATVLLRISMRVERLTDG